MMSTIKEIRAKKKNIGFLSFSNVDSITIPLERIQTASIHSNVTVINANMEVLAGIATGTNVVVRKWSQTTIDITSQINGTNLVITPTGTLWGDTLVIVNANYDLSWGG